MESNTDLRTPPTLKAVKGLEADYKPNSFFLTSGVILTVLGLLFVVVLGHASIGMVLAMGILFIVRGMSAPLKFREDHLIYKAAPAAKTHQVDYSAIKSIDYQAKRIILHCGDKDVKINKDFDSSDWQAIIDTFNQIEKA